MAERWGGLRLALTTLTIAPVRGPREVDRTTAGRAMTLAPLVGLALGLVAGTVLIVFRELTGYGPPLLAAVVAVGALVAATRALHLDGLADTVDGLGSYLPPEAARAVMKRPDLGPLGLAAVVLALLLQVSALMTSVLGGRGTVTLLVGAVCGRLAVTAACTPTTPAATSTGLGAMVAGTVGRGVPLAATLALGALLTAAGALDDDTRSAPLTNGLRVALALGLGLLAARLLRRHAVRRLGGLTGDVLGALLEVATTVSMVVMACGVPPSLQRLLG